KELGVTAVGHRLKLLDAIAALRAEAGVTGPSAAAGATSSAPSARPEDRAERCPVTVMFSDLGGSTALAARMDPEDLREVILARTGFHLENVGYSTSNSASEPEKPKLGEERKPDEKICEGCAAAKHPYASVGGEENHPRGPSQGDRYIASVE